MFQKNQTNQTEIQKIHKFLDEEKEALNSESKTITREEMTTEQLKDYNSNIESLLQEVIKMKFEA